MTDMTTQRDAIQELLESLSPEQHTELARAALTIAMHLGSTPEWSGADDLDVISEVLARPLADANLPHVGESLRQWAEMEGSVADLEREGYLERVITCHGCDELLDDCTCEECEQCGEELDEDDLVSFAVAGVCTMCETGLER